ncbi:MAG: hypothetical protein V8Q67_03430 [Blautia massiliensis (ex Durand et al. 2017)]
MACDRRHVPWRGRTPKKTTKELADIDQTDISNIQKDAKEARNTLTTLILGPDAMVLYDFRD